jgi:cell division protein FtsN
MEYQISLTRKRLVLIIAAVVISGVLIFVCGVAAGKKLGGMADAGAQGIPGAIPNSPLLTALGMNPMAKVNQAKGLLKPPVVPKTQAQVVQAANTVTALRAAAAAPAAPGAAPANATPQASAAPSPAPAAPAPAAPDPVAVIPPAAGAVAAIPDPVKQPFMVQFGAFRDLKQAKALQEDLQKKGCTAAIYNLLDADRFTWHVVRFGGYQDMNSASQAASELTKRLEIQALVKRSDSL